MRHRVFAIPSEHGAWALWIGPFLVGWGAAGRTSWPLMWTLLAIFFAFMGRHPLMILVRALAGRRKRQDAKPAAFWAAGYFATAAGCAVALIASGQARLLLLALPALPLLSWQMILVARNEERQIGIELVGTGVLALAAPAAHVAATGQWTALALTLWLMMWLYAAVSIFYVYLRLEQRRLTAVPSVTDRLLMGRTAMRVGALALVVVSVATFLGALPRYAPLAWLIVQLQIIIGTIRPAAGYRPTNLGHRQVLSTALFVVVLVLTFQI